MSYIPILLFTALLLIVATGIIMLVLIYQKKQLQYLNEKAMLQSKFDKEILESRLEIQEQTMKHISQEVHDNIGQVLSVVKLNLNMMDCDDPSLKDKIKDTNDLVGQAIQDLRDLSKSLHSDVITTKGLIKAIQYECGILKKTGAYTTTLTITGDPYPLPEQNELILFRIFQEAMNNTLKHANATLIETFIQFQPGKFLLRMHDNGKGFNSQIGGRSDSLGIRNIISRSELIGAYYNIDSQEGNGTSISVELPVK